MFSLTRNLELLDPLNVSMQDNSITHRANHRLREPTQGDTVATVWNIAGPRVYSDAAWRSKKAPGDEAIGATGIRIFIQFQREGQNFNIMIQASTDYCSSALQAEAKAMQLATSVSEALHLTRPTFLTDNLSLAKAVADLKIDTHHLHWNCRNTLAMILNSFTKQQSQVFHIKRDLNGGAHNCAHKVLRRSLGSPILDCSSSAHTSPHCPAISSLIGIDWQGFVIHDVHCC